jgi:hypothetical protein
MVIMESSLSLKRVFRTAFIIYGALVAGLFLYALIVELIKSQFKPFSGFSPASRIQVVRYVFYGAAVLAVGLLRTAAIRLIRAAPGGDCQHFFIQRLSRAAIVTAILAELPAVFGFVLFLWNGSSRDFYSLLFVSLFLEFMYFPRLRVWQDLVRERFP